MAANKTQTKNKTQQKKASPKKEPVPISIRVNNVIRDERFKFLMSIFTLLFSAYTLLAFISFLFTWKVDQSILDYSVINFLFDSEIVVENWAGKLGALLANLFIYKWFGISSFVIIYLLVIFAFRLLNIRIKPIRKSLKYAAFGIIWTSITLSYFLGDFYIFLGGAYGYFLSNWLSSIMGSVGTFLFLLISLIAFVLFTFENALPWAKTFATNVKDKKEIKSAFQAANQSIVNKNSNEDETELEDIDEEFEEEIKIAQKAPIQFKEELIDDEDDDFLYTRTKDLDTEKETVLKKNFILRDDGKELDTDELGFEVENNINRTIEEILKPQEKSVEESDATTLALAVEKNKDIQNTESNVELFGEYDPTLDLSSYVFPSLELLEDHHSGNAEVTNEELIGNKNKIVETLGNYKIEITKIKATIGPTVTLYEIIPAPGVRISKIKNLEDDIALSLSALGIRIIAPMPGRGTIGIEVPNQKPEIVSMKSVISSARFQESKFELPIALGKTISNETYVVDLTKMPHLLVAGATGQGKSVGLNAILTSLLYKKHPSQLKFVLVDPKKVELTLYEKIERHFLAKLPDAEEAIITDTKKVIHTLSSLNIEMDSRYELLKDAQVRNIKEYNTKFIARKLNPERGHRYLPYIVVIIDEFADLIMTAGKEVELPIARIAQLARAVGIHLIVATQRPSTNIITGVIKANFPARLAFKVASMIDSRTILDSPGANQLIGRGDMLITQGSDLIRLQCAFIDTPELDKITSFIGNQRGYPSAMLLPQYEDEDFKDGEDFDMTKRDDLFDDAARLVVMTQQGSTSLIQRKMSIGYNRAGRIIDQLEAAGIVGPFEGSKARQVLFRDIIELDHFLGSLGNKN